jgi:hypothetical protein
MLLKWQHLVRVNADVRSGEILYVRTNRACEEGAER